MIIAVPVTPQGQVDTRWGKAHYVAVAQLDAGEIASWEQHEVSWDDLHDQAGHGSHHARIVRFLREHSVEAVVINHCGAPMMNTMEKMGLVIVVDAQGDAREIALRAEPIIRSVLEEEAAAE